MKYLISILFLQFSLFAKAQSDFNNIFSQKLNNGLLCVVVENPATPLNTIELVVKDGSIYEPPSESGIAYLNSYFFYAANKDYPSTDKMTQRIKQLGAVTGGLVDEEYSSFYITLTGRNLENGLKLMNSAARFPLYLEEDLQNAQKNMLADLQSAKSNPDYILSQGINSRMMGESASRKNVYGNFNIVSAISPDKLMEHHKLFYTPANCVLLVSGDVQHEEVFQKVQTLFGSWEKATEIPADKFPVPDVTVPYSSQLVVQSLAASTPVLTYSFQAPDLITFPQYTYAAKVWTAMIASPESRFDSVLTSSGLVQQINTDYKPERFLNTLSISIVPNTAKLKSCIEQVNNELKKVNLYSYYSDNLLNDAKKQAKIEFAFQNEINTALSHSLAFASASSGINYFTDYEKNIDAVTMDDIIHFTKLFIVGKPVTTGLLISPAQKGALQTDNFFLDTFSPEEYIIKFTRNTGEIIGVQNKDMINSLIQFVRLNPDIHLELIATQDAVERKETAKERFLSVYKQLEAGGLGAKFLENMKVSIYIRHGNTDNEISNNMTVSFKAVK